MEDVIVLVNCFNVYDFEKVLQCYDKICVKYIVKVIKCFRKIGKIV